MVERSHEAYARRLAQLQHRVSHAAATGGELGAPQLRPDRPTWPAPNSNAIRVMGKDAVARDASPYMTPPTVPPPTAHQSPDAATSSRWWSGKIHLTDSTSIPQSSLSAQAAPTQAQSWAELDREAVQQQQYQQQQQMTAREQSQPSWPPAQQLQHPLLAGALEPPSSRFDSADLQPLFLCNRSSPPRRNACCASSSSTAAAAAVACSPPISPIGMVPLYQLGGAPVCAGSMAALAMAQGRPVPPADMGAPQGFGGPLHGAAPFAAQGSSPATALRPPLILSAPQPSPLRPKALDHPATLLPEAPLPPPPVGAATGDAEHAAAGDAAAAAMEALEEEGLLAAAQALVEASSGGPSAANSPKMPLADAGGEASPLMLDSFLSGPAFAFASSLTPPLWGERDSPEAAPGASQQLHYHPTPKQRSDATGPPHHRRPYSAANHGIDRLHISPRSYRANAASRSRSGRESPTLLPMARWPSNALGGPRRAKPRSASASPDAPLAPLGAHLTPHAAAARRSSSRGVSPLLHPTAMDCDGCEVLSPLEGSFAHTPDFGKLWSPPPKPADGLAMESD